MADNNKDKRSDVISSDQQSSKQTIFNYDNRKELFYLMSIDENVKRLVRNGQTVSQSNARMAGNPYEDSQTSFRRMQGFRTGKKLGGFTDEFEKALWESVLGSDFKDKVGKAVSTFADSLGLEIRDIPGTIGKHLGQEAVSLFKGTKIGESFYNKVDEFKKSTLSSLRDKFEERYKEKTGKESPWAAARRASENSAKTEDVNTSESSSKQDFSEKDSGPIVSSIEDVLKHAEYLDDIQKHIEHIDDILSVIHETPGAEDQYERLYQGHDKSDTRDLGTKIIEKRLKESAEASASAVQDGGLLPTAASEGASLAEEGLANIGVDAAQAGEVLSGVLSGGISAAGEALTMLGPQGLAAAAALIAVIAAAELVKKALKYAFGPAIEGASELLNELGKTANRRELTRKENRKLAEERYIADIKTIVEAPFKILEKAAEKVEQAWDANLRKINATQGYSKADLQDLMATYADRLRQDNLSSVVSGSDIIDNLASILDQGLSGEVANEFAYLATVLNAAIPTQDFFGYAGTYSAIAANAIKEGKSQAEALQYANSQLESFASSVLYANRELAGGFSTGLKNAQSLFEDSVKIAQSSRTGVPSEIAGVLTSVSAIVGAIAPDLSTSITDAVTKAAIGGNSSDVVALRSLSGINASNTEFLKALANNPQKVFSDLFNNLANMFNDTDDAWMEKAEAYSQVFGLSMDAFARVDFNYLADAISQMKVDNSALTQNMDQLISGETTTNKELLRMQQINQYMIEEGLAYVLDNEVAREIQRHMWDEQIARNIMENEYAVNLKGKALEFLDSLRTTLERILNILNPVKWITKAVTDIAGTIAESLAQDSDIKRILEAGKVGEGREVDLYNLTHRNQELQLTPNYAELLTGRSAYSTTSKIRGFVDNFLHLTDGGLYNSIANAADLIKFSNRELHQLSSAISDASKSSIRSIQSTESTFNSTNSIYDWELVSKSVASNLSKAASYLSKSSYTAYTSSSVSSDYQKSEDLYAERYQKLIDAAQASIDTMYDEADKFISDASRNEMLQYTTYKDWEKAILAKVNVRDMNEFLSYGMEESDVAEVQKILRNAYEDAQTAVGGQQEQAELEDTRLLREQTRQEWQNVEEYRIWEKDFRSRQEQFWSSTNTKFDNIIALTTYGNQVLDDTLVKNTGIYNTLIEFLKAWKNYFVEHTAYRESYDSSAVERIQREEKGEASTAVYRLAEALTSNDTELLDPVMQTNALLSQILLVAQAIMQQNNSSVGGNVSLFNTLQATALGLVKTE